jgi:hypothetical protein
MPDNPSAGGPVTWRVTGQAEQLVRNPAGAFVPGVLISFETSSGIAGTVTVPADRYGPEYVREAVTERVRSMAAVHGLSGTLQV